MDELDRLASDLCRTIEGTYAHHDALRALWLRVLEQEVERVRCEDRSPESGELSAGGPLWTPEGRNPERRG